MKTVTIKQLKSRKGQTTVEYLLIIAVLVVVISFAGKTLQQKVPEVINTLFGGINKNIQGLMNKAGGN